MQQATHQISDPSAATALLENVLSRKCKRHPSFPCESVQIRPTLFSPRLCCQCVEDQKIPSSEYVSIRYLLKASSKTIFQSYPKFTDNSIIDKLQQFKDNNDRISEELNNFFKNLSSTISMEIEKQNSAQKDKLSYLFGCYQSIYDTLAEIQQIEKLQQLVCHDNDEHLKRFINDQYLNSNSYTQKISSKVSEYEKIYSGFSLADSKKKFDQIIEIIKSIEFFSTSIQSLQNHQLLDVQQQQQQHSFQKPIRWIIPSSLQLSQQQQQQQHGQQIQQLKQEPASSLEDYNNYQSLMKEGRLKNILWWKMKNQSYEWYESSQSLKSYKYAEKYEQWKSFSEESRKEQLQALKAALNIPN